MQVVTKKLPIDEEMITVQLRVHRCNEARIKAYAEAVESGDERTWSVAEVFPDYVDNLDQIALRAYRCREGLTQKKLSELSDIPQHHISEMENGKRGIGKERAKRLAKALCISDYRVFM